MPNHVGLNSFPLGLRDDSFLDPSDWLPALELDHDFVGADWLHEIEEHVAIDSIPRKVEWFVDLDETTRHIVLSWLKS